jgi:uncharacterized membrane protein YphA (DoxX/SURF4 family)
MFAALVMSSSLLAFLALASGLAKINGIAQMRTLLEHVGASRFAHPIGYLEILGALGLVVGLFVVPVGIAAAMGLMLLFAGAVVAHLHVHDPMSQWGNPAVPLALAIASLLLRVATS